jgi:hypothetical protein
MARTHPAPSAEIGALENLERSLAGDSTETGTFANATSPNSSFRSRCAPHVRTGQTWSLAPTIDLALRGRQHR